MDEQNEIMTNRALSRIKWRRIVIGISLICVAILAMGYFLRSSLYLKVRLTPKLEKLGEQLEGTFEFGAIRAMGLTGIVFDEVRFLPSVEGMAPMTFDAVTVYPDLLGMFFGDLNASLIEIQGMKGVYHFDHDDDNAWLKRLVHQADDERKNSVVTSLSTIDETSKWLPRIVCESCHFDVIWDAQRRFNIHVEEYALSSDAVGNFELEGKPARVCAFIDDDWSVCFRATMDRIHLGDSTQIHRVTMEDVALPFGTAWCSFENIEVAHNEQRNVLFVESGQFSVQRGEVRTTLDWHQLEVLHERLAQRLGIGLVAHDGAGGTARIFGGYALGEHKLALTLELASFDVARRVDKKDVFSWMTLGAFPVTGKVHTVFEFARKQLWSEVELGVQEGAMTAGILSSRPMSAIRAKTTFRTWWNWGQKTFDFEHGTLQVGKIPCRFLVSRTAVDEDFRVRAELGCEGESGDFIPSLPEGFAPTLSGYQLEGPYAFQLGVYYDEKKIDDLVLNADFSLDGVKTRAYDPQSNFKILQGDAFQVRVNAATVPWMIGPREEGWVEFRDLPQETAYAFVASEDGKFFTHHGFDIRAIRASLIADLKAERVVRGGSTISQQVVKNLFLNHDKTVARKFQEAFLTWQMEKALPKLRIFELYLNLAHWAKDIYGIRAAARYYFQKNVSELSLRESLFLAAILPNPIIFGRQYAEGKLSPSRLNKMINVGNALRSRNRISEASWSAARPLIEQGIISERPRPVVRDD